MAAWDEVDLLDMSFDASREVYTYPCPCGDVFIMPVDDLICAEDLAPCPSCSLLLRVNYDPADFLKSVQVIESSATFTCTQQADDGAADLTAAETAVGEVLTQATSTSTCGTTLLAGELLDMTIKEATIIKSSDK